MTSWCPYCHGRLIPARQEKGKVFNRSAVSKLCSTCDAPGRVPANPPPRLAEPLTLAATAPVEAVCVHDACIRKAKIEGFCATHWHTYGHALDGA